MSAAIAPPVAWTAPSWRASYDVQFALLCIWTLGGLFVDGWSHSSGATEAFFNPVHGAMYAGVAAMGAWLVVRRPVLPRAYRSAMAGTAALWATGPLDLLWHQRFGIETSLAANLSPPHLFGMTAGLVVLAGPLAAAARRCPARPTWRGFLPVLLPATVEFGLAAYMVKVTNPLRYSPFDDTARAYAPGEAFDAVLRHGVTAVALTSALFAGAVAMVLRRWEPPAGSLVAFVGVVGVGIAAVGGFQVGLSAMSPVVAAGVVELVMRRTATRNVGVLCGLFGFALWAVYFATASSVAAPAEIWGGAIVFGTLAAAATGALAEGRTGPYGSLTLNAQNGTRRL